MLQWYHFTAVPILLALLFPVSGDGRRRQTNASFHDEHDSNPEPASTVTVGHNTSSTLGNGKTIL